METRRSRPIERPLIRALAHREHGPRRFSAAAACVIPVIDYGPFFAGEAGALPRLGKEIAQAAENVGFFYALNHGVADELLARTFAAARKFFALLLEQKLGIKLNNRGVGYLPINASVQSASNVGKAILSNRSESLFIGREAGGAPPDPVQEESLSGGNQWPAEIPGFQPDIMAYFAALEAMCARLLPPLAVALGEPADFFEPYFRGEADARLRLLHYPPQDPSGGHVFGQRPHTDNSFITALARTEVPGLVVRLPSGEWFPPPVIPGSLLINLGNIMRRWSNDRFLSVPHAVLNASGTDRYSIAYFYNPNPDRVIECVPSCAGPDNPPLYPPALYRNLAADFYRARPLIAAAACPPR
jgi:isopenicillin N synthase-like dioxygenase